MRSADMILERVKVREVAGIFRSWEQSDAAVDALLSSGIDRADVDLTTAEEARARLGIDIPAEELPEVSGIPRRPIVRREDLLILGGLSVGMAAFAGAALGAFVVIASGGGTVPAVLAALLGAVPFAAIAALIAEMIARRKLPQLDTTKALVLLVRVRSAEQEDKAQQMLREYGAEAVRVHEIDIEKRLEEVPLSSLRVDPWLGEHGRLGRP
jgi:outer membrane lipoprotein SlyB